MAQNKENPNRSQRQQGERGRDTIKQEEARRREERHRATEQMKNKAEESPRHDRSKDSSRLPE